MIARVFPSKTKLTPDDNLAFYGPPGLFVPDVAEIHVSVLFTWDLGKAEWLKHQWSHIAPVKCGGPAYGVPSGEFIPKMYVKEGGVITSRGCPNKCWFCSVWKREPQLIELPIHSGWNLLDDNILACSEEHIRSVFTMLKNQPKPIEFTGGLEAKLLKEWHVEEMTSMRIKQMFFAYDTPDDYEPLVNASKLLLSAGFNRNKMRCYVLIGYKGDTISKATKRLQQCLKLGFYPMAMLLRQDKKERSYNWKKFQRTWSRPAIISQMEKQL